MTHSAERPSSWPSGSSRVWLGPAAKPSAEMAMSQTTIDMGER